MIILSIDRVFSTSEPFNRPDNLHGLHPECVGFVHSTIDHRPESQPYGLPCSASRVAGENGPSVRRAFGHAASPRRGTQRPGLPASRARRSPGRSAGLRSGLFWPEAKTIPPLHPSPASGRPVCLLGSGKPTIKTHTHECGSISSGWPPNQPASRIAKLFGEGGARGAGRPRA